MVSTQSAIAARKQREQESIEALYERLHELDSNTDLDEHILRRVIDQQAVEQKLLFLIINRRLPLSIVE